MSDKSNSQSSSGHSPKGSNSPKAENNELVSTIPRQDKTKENSLKSDSENTKPSESKVLNNPIETPNKSSTYKPSDSNTKTPFTSTTLNLTKNTPVSKNRETDTHSFLRLSNTPESVQDDSKQSASIIVLNSDELDEKTKEEEEDQIKNNRPLEIEQNFIPLKHSPVNKGAINVTGQQKLEFNTQDTNVPKNQTSNNELLNSETDSAQVAYKNNPIPLADSQGFTFKKTENTKEGTATKATLPPVSFGVKDSAAIPDSSIMPNPLKPDMLKGYFYNTKAMQPETSITPKDSPSIIQPKAFEKVDNPDTINTLSDKQKTIQFPLVSPINQNSNSQSNEFLQTSLNNPNFSFGSKTSQDNILKTSSNQTEATSKPPLSESNDFRNSGFDFKNTASSNPSAIEFPSNRTPNLFTFNEKSDTPQTDGKTSSSNNFLDKNPSTANSLSKKENTITQNEKPFSAGGFNISAPDNNKNLQSTNSSSKTPNSTGLFGAPTFQNISSKFGDINNTKPLESSSSFSTFKQNISKPEDSTSTIKPFTIDSKGPISFQKSSTSQDISSSDKPTSIFGTSFSQNDNSKPQGPESTTKPSFGAFNMTSEQHGSKPGDNTFKPSTNIFGGSLQNDFVKTGDTVSNAKPSPGIFKSLIPTNDSLKPHENISGTNSSASFFTVPISEGNSTKSEDKASDIISKKETDHGFSVKPASTDKSIPENSTQSQKAFATNQSSQNNQPISNMFGTSNASSSTFSGFGPQNQSNISTQTLSATSGVTENKTESIASVYNKVLGNNDGVQLNPFFTQKTPNNNQLFGSNAYAFGNNFQNQGNIHTTTNLNNSVSVPVGLNPTHLVGTGVGMICNQVANMFDPNNINYLLQDVSYIPKDLVSNNINYNEIPKNCSPQLWQQAVLNNPDPVRFVPVVLFGFKGIMEHTNQQHKRMTMLKDKIKSAEEKIEDTRTIMSKLNSTNDINTIRDNIAQTYERIKLKFSRLDVSKIKSKYLAQTICVVQNEFNKQRILEQNNSIKQNGILLTGAVYETRTPICGDIRTTNEWMEKLRENFEKIKKMRETYYLDTAKGLRKN